MVANDLNEDVSTWATLASAFASIRWGSTNERLSAAQTAGSQAAVFRVRSTASMRSVTIRDRIVHLNANWNIVGVSQMRDHLEFTCERAV